MLTTDLLSYPLAATSLKADFAACHNPFRDERPITPAGYLQAPNRARALIDAHCASQPGSYAMAKLVVLAQRSSLAVRFLLFSKNFIQFDETDSLLICLICSLA